LFPGVGQQGGNFAMNENCVKQTIEEPRYFLLWIALWIVALLVLLPQA
jgi:hypothetical protein